MADRLRHFPRFSLMQKNPKDVALVKILSLVLVLILFDFHMFFSAAQALVLDDRLQMSTSKSPLVVILPPCYMHSCTFSVFLLSVVVTGWSDRALIFVCFVLIVSVDV